MSLIIDIVLALVALIIIIRCWSNGFAVSVLRFCRIFIALIGAVVMGRMTDSILGFIIGFILVFVAVTVVMQILKLVNKIPIIHGLDKFVGLLLGIACAFLTLVIVSSLLYSALYYYDAIFEKTGGMAIYEGSKIFKFMGRYFK